MAETIAALHEKVHKPT